MGGALDSQDIQNSAKQRNCIAPFFVHLKEAFGFPFVFAFSFVYAFVFLSKGWLCVCQPQAGKQWSAV